MLHPRALADLVEIGIHEAAHSMVAHCFGLVADWKVWLSSTANPEAENIFDGVCHATGHFPSEEAARVYYLAGLIAEIVLENDGPVAADKIYGRLATGALRLSTSDAAGAGCFTVSDIECCQGLVVEHWEKIIKDAYQMVLSVIDAAELEAAERGQHDHTPS